MTDKLTVINERVDDIPLLLTQQERMGVPQLLDEHFPTHGNWQGLSLGWTASIWASHILSKADHRLNHVQGWAEKCQETLSGCAGQTVRSLDFSDDRLAIVTKAFSDDDRWDAFENALNRRTLRVYDLTPERVRLDSTTANGYWRVTPDGLFQLGHSQDHRPDLPQVKVKMAALDPLGMPLVTTIVSGNRADDPLYIPAIKRVRASVDPRGLLYVGDCKMAALATRAFVHAGGDYYLCPLSQSQLSPEELSAYLTPVWEGKQSLIDIYRQKENGDCERIAQGYEQAVTLKAEVDGQVIIWTERRLLIRSLKQAQTSEKSLRTRLAKAQAALASLNEHGRGKKRFTEVADLRKAAEAIVKEHRCEGLLQLAYEEIVHERPVRRYLDRPAMVRMEQEVRLSVKVDEVALERVSHRLGWRVYVTDAPEAKLPLSQAVLAYRYEYLIERGFGRLKGKPLSLTPMYLQSDDHATGLIRLLSIALRLLTLLEFVVRRRLAQEGATLRGLYAGNPKRATAHPSAELMLEAFQGITLTVIQEAGQTRRYLAPLSTLQQRVLEFLDFPQAIYTKLVIDSS